LYKLINQSLQGFNIFLKASGTEKSFWLKPKESVLIEENSISTQIRRMVNRRLLKLERT
jgi:hypothetical protein